MSDLRVLVVCSGTTTGGSEFSLREHKPYVHEQVESLRMLGVEVDVLPTPAGGLRGYASAAAAVRQRLRTRPYDLVHAHFGLSGLPAVAQRYVPVVVTFHGSDVNRMGLNVVSSLVAQGADWRIFVSSRLHRRMYLRPGKNFSVIPCGVDLDLFRPLLRAEARRRLGWEQSARYVLFPGSRDNTVKNFRLARAVVERLDENARLVELKGYTREEVRLVLNACDALLVTSHSEGSPLVVKEALACGRPIVSVNVGDVLELLKRVRGCFVCFSAVDELSGALSRAVKVERTDGRDRVAHLGLEEIAREIVGVYRRVLELKNRRTSRGSSRSGMPESTTSHG